LTPANVPARETRRLLHDMPLGSPGMDGSVDGGREDGYKVLLLTRDGGASVYQDYKQKKATARSRSSPASMAKLDGFAMVTSGLSGERAHKQKACGLTEGTLLTVGSGYRKFPHRYQNFQWMTSAPDNPTAPVNLT
jgi:hypothetical protein